MYRYVYRHVYKNACGHAMANIGMANVIMAYSGMTDCLRLVHKRSWLGLDV